jgi:hypothetical protein
MLKPNISYVNQTLGKMHSGVTNHHSQFQPEVMFNRFIPSDSTNLTSIKRDSFPTGTQPPYSFLLGIKGALISSTTQLNGTGALTGGFSLGKSMTANLSGSGDVSAALSITSSLAATIAASGSLTASMTATLGLAASLAGTGNLAASLSLLTTMLADLDGVGDITANLKGNLDLEASIYVNQSEAAVQQLVAGVWGALAADYDESGTMGEKLNAAGTAGDPWTTDLSSYETQGTAGKIMKDTLSEDNFLALK